MNWNKYDKKINITALNKEVAEAKNNTGEFWTAPDGQYYVTILEMELTTSKSNKPMTKIVMEIAKGEFKNKKIYYFQVVEAGFGIHKIREFLRALDYIDLDDKFTGYSQLNEDLEDTLEEYFEYDDLILLEVSSSESDGRTFTNYTIIED